MIYCVQSDCGRAVVHARGPKEAAELANLGAERPDITRVIDVLTGEESVWLPPQEAA